MVTLISFLSISICITLAHKQNMKNTRETKLWREKKENKMKINKQKRTRTKSLTIHARCKSLSRFGWRTPHADAHARWATAFMICFFISCVLRFRFLFRQLLSNGTHGTIARTHTRTHNAINRIVCVTTTWNIECKSMQSNRLCKMYCKIRQMVSRTWSVLISYCLRTSATYFGTEKPRPLLNEMASTICEQLLSFVNALHLWFLASPNENSHSLTVTLKSQVESIVSTSAFGAH